MHFFSSNSPLQAINSDLFPGIQLWVKRDDLLHPQISGNKFRKLKYVLTQTEKPIQHLVSMGGPWSNHLHALAFAAQRLGIPSTGLVRGLRAQDQALTATLDDCQNWGMQLHFLSRMDYRVLRQEPLAWQRYLPGRDSCTTVASGQNWSREAHQYWGTASTADSNFGRAVGSAEVAGHIAHQEQVLWIAEGGLSLAGVLGVAESVQEIHQTLGRPADSLVCACGTGTTLAGLALGTPAPKRVIGIAAVSNAHYLHAQVDQLRQQANSQSLSPLHNSELYKGLSHAQIEIHTEFDQGGFAKMPPALLRFCAQFEASCGIEIEAIYTGKMFYALHQLAKRGHFREGEVVVAIHTGGLQGKRSYAK